MFTAFTSDHRVLRYAAQQRRYHSSFTRFKCREQLATCSAVEVYGCKLNPATAQALSTLAVFLVGVAAVASARQLTQPPLQSRLVPLLIAWIGMCGGWYSTVLWIPEYFKARGAGNSSLYAESFAVAAANLPGMPWQGW